MVYLKLQPHLQSSVAYWGNHKLSFRFVGPYDILQKVSDVAYTLALPRVQQDPSCGTYIPTEETCPSMYPNWRTMSLQLFRHLMICLLSTFIHYKQCSQNLFWASDINQRGLRWSGRYWSNGCHYLLTWLLGRKFMIFVIVFPKHQLGDKLVLKERALLEGSP
jgi:hypothetical protein